MSVMARIVKMIPADSTLKTPTGRAKFHVIRCGPSGVDLEIGKNGFELQIPGRCFEGIPDFLATKDWIPIGSIHGTTIEGTLDNYVQRFTHRGTSAASYVASMLEKINTVEIDRTRLPMRIRLRE